jgi:hypothetical protein
MTWRIASRISPRWFNYFQAALYLHTQMPKDSYQDNPLSTPKYVYSQITNTSRSSSSLSDQMNRFFKYESPKQINHRWFHLELKLASTRVPIEFCLWRSPESLVSFRVLSLPSIGIYAFCHLLCRLIFLFYWWAY